MMVSIVFCAVAGQSSCDRNSGDWFQKVWYGAPESGWPSSDSSWQCYYMLATTTKLSMLFQVLGLWLHLKEIPYSAKFSRVFNFANFQLFTKIFHRKFLTRSMWCVCAANLRNYLELQISLFAKI